MNAREWKPGDVAVTAKGTIALCHNGGQMIDQGGAPWSDDRFPDNLRPLVVIDPECTETALEPIWIALRDGWALQSRPNLRAALRSLIGPPKPEEPLGLGAVVEDAEGRKYIRTADTDCAKPWSYANNYSDHSWADVAAVKVLSEGVTA